MYLVHSVVIAILDLLMTALYVKVSYKRRSKLGRSFLYEQHPKMHIFSFREKNLWWMWLEIAEIIVNVVFWGRDP